MKNTGGESAVHVGLAKDLGEMLRYARSAGGHEGNGRDRPRLLQLFDIEAFARAVLAHAIENDLSRAHRLDLADPFHREPPRNPGLLRVAGVLPNPPLTIGVPQ